MRYRTITILCLFILVTAVSAGATEQITPEYVTKANQFLKEQMKRTNALTQEHFGVLVFHNIFFTPDGMIVMDLNEKGFDFAPYTREAQLDKMMDDILIDREALIKANVTGIRVFIEGVFFKEYEL